MRLLLLALTLFFACAGSTARAEGIKLAPLTCVGGGESQAEALALHPSELDCGRGRFATTRAFLRTHSDLSQSAMPLSQRLVWQSDPAAFDSLLLKLTWSDGSDSWIDVDPQMAARNWAAGAQFSVPLPHEAGGRRLTAIDAVIEQARMPATAQLARLVSAREAVEAHFMRSILDAIILGMLLVPIAYTLTFYRALRARFMLWHVAMSAAMAVFALSNTGLIFAFIPGLPLYARWQLNSASLVIALICALFFTFGLLEKGRLSQHWKQAMMAALAIPVLVKIVMALDIAALRALNGFFSASFLPLILVSMCALVHALRRGSRAAVYVLVSFGAVALAGLIIIADGAGLVSFPLHTEDVLLGSMVVMSIAGAAAVGDRFIVLRMNLDRERGRAAWFGELANSDALTGLGNRRAFDAREVLYPHEALVVADLDNFKLINDRAGHSAGDAALRRVARTLVAAVEGQEGCAVYRLGGEEFGIVVPFDNEAQLRERCEALRKAVAAADIAREMDVQDGPLTISLGAVPGTGQTIARAFVIADQAMYRAKRMGRNCVRLAVDLDEVEDAIELDLRLSRI